MSSLEQIKGDTFMVSVDELINTIVTQKDFVIINGRIEPTRELALKLFTVTRIENYSVDLQEVVTTEKETVYVCKAVLQRQGKKAEGLGACSTVEIDKRGGQSRHHHDALATAETRAYKRAIEVVVGLPFINEIILKLFGGYEKPSGERADTPIITPDEFIQKIREARSINHLYNIWVKYRANLLTYSQEDKLRIEREKDSKKHKLKEEAV